MLTLRWSMPSWQMSACRAPALAKASDSILVVLRQKSHTQLVHKSEKTSKTRHISIVLLPYMAYYKQFLAPRGRRCQRTASAGACKLQATNHST
jgi:hypothetical protein